MMKRIAIVLALVPALASAHDLTPGTFELSGGSNLGLNSGSTKQEQSGASAKTDTSNYGLNTTGLYYVIPNLGIGLGFGYRSDSEKDAFGVKTTTSQFVVGPAVAYEVPIAPEFSVFGRGELDYVSGKTTVTGLSDASASGYGFQLEAGVKYFLVKNFSFNAGLGYQYATVDDNSTPKVTTTLSNFGLNVGLSVYFGGGK
jgi:predicted porin